MSLLLLSLSFAGEREEAFSSSSSSSRAVGVSKITEIRIKTDLLHDRRLGEAARQVLLQGFFLERLVGLEDVLPPGVARRAGVGKDLGPEDEVAGESRGDRGEREDSGGGEGRDELRGGSSGLLFFFFLTMSSSLLASSKGRKDNRRGRKR